MVDVGTVFAHEDLTVRYPAGSRRALHLTRPTWQDWLAADSMALDWSAGFLYVGLLLQLNLFIQSRRIRQ